MIPRADVQTIRRAIRALGTAIDEPAALDQALGLLEELDDAIHAAALRLNARNTADTTWRAIGEAVHRKGPTVHRMWGTAEPGERPGALRRMPR